MCAEFHQVGEVANDAERGALEFLRDQLPDDYVVYGNPWLVQHSGQVFEVDAVVVGENAVYVVEMKAYRGRVTGNEHDWTVNRSYRKSPVKLNRKTAQILKTELKRKNGEARRIWVQGFVFLTHTALNELTGQVCRDTVYTRSTILGALKNAALVHRLSGGPARTPSAGLRASIHELLKGADPARRPRRTLGDYQLKGVYDRTESYVEHHGYNEAADTERILRFWEVPPLASDEKRDAVRRRAIWASRILAGLVHRHILRSDPLVEVDVGYVLPLEYFPGLTLTTWLERHGPSLRENQDDDIPARVALWRKIAGAMRHAHDQGVVHRLLRPDVVWVEDKTDDPDLRVGGFDLAKRLRSDDTVSWTAVGDERLDFAAPEIVNAFSDAEFESDQFSLGALLGLLLTGRPLFASTLDYMQKGRLPARPRDLNPRLPGALDESVVRMLALRSPDRFANLEEAEDAVVRAIEPRRPTRQRPDPAPVDPDHLVPGVRLGDFDVRGKLGEGGQGVVYSATHRATGSLRALKIARPNDKDREALLREHKLLEKLHHPGLVTVQLPSDTMVADRLVLVMEHVEGRTLRQWLPENPDADAGTRHRFAEDLLGALEYLEQEGVTHNDLKPDNLLVGKGGLRVIDFSLASEKENEVARGGTARYRDPAISHWSHASDRYAAALCLFELFVGRHPFGGRIRSLDEKLQVQEGEVDPPGLAKFFRTALDHRPEERFASVLKMRDALRKHLGDHVEPEAPVPAAITDLQAETEVHRLQLSNRAVNQLRRAGVATAGALLALEPGQIRALRSVGTKTATEIVRVQDEIRERGLEAVVRPEVTVRPALFPELIDDEAPIRDLPGVTENLAQALETASLGSLHQWPRGMRTNRIACQHTDSPTRRLDLAPAKPADPRRESMSTKRQGLYRLKRDEFLAAFNLNVENRRQRRPPRRCTGTLAQGRFAPSSDRGATGSFKELCQEMGLAGGERAKPDIVVHKAAAYHDQARESARRAAAGPGSMRMQRLTSRLESIDPSDKRLKPLVADLALPDYFDLPSSSFKRRDGLRVPILRALKLPMPVRLTALRNTGSRAARMLMPETAVNKDYRPIPRQHYVRRSGEPFGVDPEAQAGAVQERANTPLRAGVPIRYPTHHATSSLGAHKICHHRTLDHKRSGEAR